MREGNHHCMVGHRPCKEPSEVVYVDDALETYQCEDMVQQERQSARICVVLWVVHFVHFD